jgi:CrcB protein
MPTGGQSRTSAVLFAIAAGGALGSLARYAMSLALPHTPGEFATATLATNVIGCLLIGVLMTALGEAAAPHRLLRPFLGVGVLGGFTTYSTFVIDALDTARAGHLGVALLYTFGSLIIGLLAVMTGVAVTRTWFRRARRSQR